MRFARLRADLRRRALVALLLGASGATEGACNVTASNLSFGPYDPLGGSGAATSGTLTVSCSGNPTPRVRVYLTPSTVSGTFVPRRLRRLGGEETLRYNLYADPGGTRILGDGTGATTTLSESIVNQNSRCVIIYGRIPPGQDVPPGDYSDNVSIAVDF